MNHFISGLALLITLIYSLGCKGSKNSHDKNDNDSVTVIDGKSISDVRDVFNNDSFEVEDLGEIKRGYIEKYKNTFVLDTSIISKQGSISIQFRHFCVFDSVLVVPEKYVEIYGIKEFVTHSFQSHLKISTVKGVLIDTVITKNAFAQVLPIELKEYGVLLFPNVQVLQDHLKINYSVSIPLTDVGRGYSLLCDYIGHIQFPPESPS